MIIFAFVHLFLLLLAREEKCTSCKCIWALTRARRNIFRELEQEKKQMMATIMMMVRQFKEGAAGLFFLIILHDQRIRTRMERSFCGPARTHGREEDLQLCPIVHLCLYLFILSAQKHKLKLTYSLGSNK